MHLEKHVHTRSTKHNSLAKDTIREQHSNDFVWISQMMLRLTRRNTVNPVHVWNIVPDVSQHSVGSRYLRFKIPDLQFHSCPSCTQISWKRCHIENMTRYVKRLKYLQKDNTCISKLLINPCWIWCWLSPGAPLSFPTWPRRNSSTDSSWWWHYWKCAQQSVGRQEETGRLISKRIGCWTSRHTAQQG